MLGIRVIQSEVRAAQGRKSEYDAIPMLVIL